MYKYIIFSELCPAEHNLRTQNATLLRFRCWDLGRKQEGRVGAKLTAMGLGVLGMGGGCIGTGIRCGAGDKGVGLKVLGLGFLYTIPNADLGAV